MKTLLFILLFDQADIAIYGGIIVIAIGIAIYSAVKIKRAKRRINTLLEEAKQHENAGNNQRALEVYKNALEHVFGINGKTEWTAQGLIDHMDKYGWDILNKIESIYTKAGKSFKKEEIRDLINDFKVFSMDKKLVDKDGLPKGKGKPIYKNMRNRLIEFHAKIN